MRTPEGYRIIGHGRKYHSEMAGLLAGPWRTKSLDVADHMAGRWQVLRMIGKGLIYVIGVVGLALLVLALCTYASWGWS